ncbi:unnamed protein product [Closterium sp. NIES-64]|nr:unnamed protein product [Closterium sp. NIES-64]
MGKAVAIEKVVVHPLVLLSIVDHYNRVAKDTHKRVLGVLLRRNGARPHRLPFEEDDKDASIWFLDHNYHEAMFAMFKKINAKERVVGWYSTGPKIRESDLDIQELFYNYCSGPVLVTIHVQPRELLIHPLRLLTHPTHHPCAHPPLPACACPPSSILQLLQRPSAGDHRPCSLTSWSSTPPLTHPPPYSSAHPTPYSCVYAPMCAAPFNSYCSDPVLVIIDVQPRELAIPSQAYCTVEDVKEDGTQKSQKAFVHISSEIGAYEAEEIGVEHLLRDVKDATITTLASESIKECSPCPLVLPNPPTSPRPPRIPQVSAKLVALKGLESRLRQLRSYLDLVAAGRLPLRADILYGVQDAFNLLPNLNVDDLVKAFAGEFCTAPCCTAPHCTELHCTPLQPHCTVMRADILYGVQDAFNLLPNLNVDDLVKAFAVRTNDMTLAVYVASLVRSIIALHNLINNKVVNKEAEKAVDSTAAPAPPVSSAAS